MAFNGLGGMFEGDSADMCSGKIPLVSMGGGAEGLACADPRARDWHERKFFFSFALFSKNVLFPSFSLNCKGK